MLDAIRRLFAGDTAKTADNEAALHLAAAVLLIEVAKSDRSIDADEFRRLRDTLKRDWQLNDSDLNGLMDVAQDASEADLAVLTSQLERYHPPESDEPSLEVGTETSLRPSASRWKIFVAASPAVTSGSSSPMIAI